MAAVARMVVSVLNMILDNKVTAEGAEVIISTGKGWLRSWMKRKDGGLLMHVTLLTPSGYE
jgi:hypothetical protein